MALLATWNDERVETAARLLLDAASAEGCLHNPWSIAELRPDSGDLDRLLQCAGRHVASWDAMLRRGSRLAQGISLPEELGTLLPTQRECLGLLILMLLAGFSRRHGNTEACFLPCRRHLDPALDRLLFQGGTLHRNVQEAIVDACERFRLRLAGAEHSVQRWYLTVRFHEGIPLNGLLRRLPFWLHGLGMPLHIELLRQPGALYAPSLEQAWRSLERFARRQRSWDKTRADLSRVAWFHGCDFDALLGAIQVFQPPVSTGGGASIGPSESTVENEIPGAESLEDVADCLLCLDTSKPSPRLLARPSLDVFTQELQGDRYELLLEGRWSTALLRGPDGSYSLDPPEFSVPFQATCVVRLLDEEDQPVPGERTLPLLPEDEVLLFDDSGQPALAPLATSQGYWIVAPRGTILLHGPAAARSELRGDHVLIWLPPGWSSQTFLSLEGEILWSPGTPRRVSPPWLKQIQLVENPESPGEFAIQKPTWVHVESIRGAGVELVRSGERWRLPQGNTFPALVDLSLMVREGTERWVLSRRVATRAALLLPTQEGSWREVPQEELEREVLASSSVRVCAPGGYAQLYYGDIPGQQAPQRAKALVGLPGRGEELALGSSRRKAPLELQKLGVSVVHRGLVQQGEVGGGKLRLTLRRPIQLRPEHRVLLWFRGRAPELVPASCHEEQWEISLPEKAQDLRVAALLFKETWQGSWWHSSWWEAVEEHPSPREALLLLRWLWLPILAEPIRERLREYVEKHPVETLISWGLLPWTAEEENPQRQEKIKEAGRVKFVQGETLWPSLPNDDSWEQAARSILLGTRICSPELAMALYEKVHVDLLHRVQPQALVPWGNLMLRFSAVWPDGSCQGRSYSEIQNARARRGQWSRAFRFLDPNQAINDKKKNKALNELRRQACLLMGLEENQMLEWMNNAAYTPVIEPHLKVSLHHEIFRRLVAISLLDKEVVR